MDSDKLRPRPSLTPPRGPVGSDSPRWSGPYSEPPRRTPEKPKRPWLVGLVAAALIGVGGVGVYHFMGAATQSASVMSTATHTSGSLTLSGADVDEAATAQAVAAITSGRDDPLIASLSPQQKQEIVSGQRKFYKLPFMPRAGTRAQTAPAPPPSVSQVKQPPPSERAAGRDRIQIALNGVIYATYDMTNQPYTLDVPLKFGDFTTLSCLELAPGESSVTVGVGTVLNPIEATLRQGQSVNFSVVQNAHVQDYTWFENQARQGNAVAEYGLGHMYQYGLGVPQDVHQAVYWYRQAANQNYRDAEARLAELGQ